MIGTTTIENVIQGFASSLQDASGGVSQMRVGLFMWTTVLCVGVGWCVYKNGTFPDVPQSICEITGAWLFGKVWQRGKETPMTNPSTNTSITG